MRLEQIEGFIWGEVVEFLTDVRKGDVIDKLLDNYEDSKGHREAVIAVHKAQLEIINGKKQNLLSEYVDDIFTREQIDMKNRQLEEEKEYHRSVIDEQLITVEDIRLDEFISSLRQLDNLYDWGLMDATPELKKEIISKVLHEFVLYPDRIELRWKLPVTAERVAETLQAY